MVRPVKKDPFTDARLLRRVEVAVQTKDKRPIKMWSHRSTTLSDFIGLITTVHSGRQYVPVYVTEGMVGHKPGESALTRVFEGHAANEKVKR